MIQRNKKIIAISLFILAGMLAGLVYWRFVGCSSGTCPITSRWHNMLLFGGVLGYLIGDSIKWKNQDKKEVEETNNPTSN